MGCMARKNYKKGLVDTKVTYPSGTVGVVGDSYPPIIHKRRNTLEQGIPF